MLDDRGVFVVMAAICAVGTFGGRWISLLVLIGPLRDLEMLLDVGLG